MTKSGAAPYVVQPTRCGCHPETCCCLPFEIMRGDERIASGVDRVMLEEMVKPAAAPTVKPCTEPQFSKEEVWAVARAVTEEGEWFYYCESGRNDYYQCNHCQMSADRPTMITHKSNCVYLIALDLLTGAPK